MNADIVLSGYDRDTEFLVTLDIVPAYRLAAVSRIAAVPSSDPDLLGVYPLTDAQAERIAVLAGADLDLERYEYCLEAIARDARSPVHPADRLTVVA